MTTHRSAFWAAISLIIALIALTALDRGTTQAKIYKYRDDQGKLHFTDNKDNIPLKYRSGPQTEEIRGIRDSSKSKSSSSGKSDGEAGTGAAGAAGAEAEQVGLSEEDTQLAKDSVALLQKGVDLAASAKGLTYTSRNGKVLYNRMQANLPAKKSLVAKLSKAKAPALVSAHGFLQGSLASDEATPPVKPEMVREIRAFMTRITGEGPPQKALVDQLNQALKDSEKEKAEAEEKEKAEGEKKKDQKNPASTPGMKP